MLIRKNLTNFLNLMISLLLFYKLFIYHPENTKWGKLSSENQSILNGGYSIINENGKVIEFGWSRKNLKSINLDEFKHYFFVPKILRNWSFKKIDQFLIMFDKKLIHLSISDSGHTSFAFIKVFDFSSGKMLANFQQTKIKMIDKKGYPEMLDDPFSFEHSEYEFEKNNFHLKVSQTANVVKNTFLSLIGVNIEDELKLKILHERFRVQNDYYELLPVSDRSGSFVYSLKSYETCCEGFINLNGQHFALSTTSCIGLGAFSRGFYDYKTNWIWVSGFGRLVDGTLFGLNLGGGIGNTDLSKSVEDFVKINGEVHKLSPVEIKLDKLDLTKTVELRTFREFDADFGYLEAVFTPINNAPTGFDHFFFKWKTTAVYGSFSGKVILKNQTVVHFDQLLGFLETTKIMW